MKCLRLWRLGLLVVLHTCVASAQAPAKSVFVLFPGDVLTSIKRLTWEERPAGRRIFQIFYDRQTRRELFRFTVGTKIDSEWLKWWRYGIAAQGDFNGDGLEDYSWYGGDDTSREEYVVISSPQGYRKVDIDATFERAWKRQYPTKEPEFGPLGRFTAAERIERNGETVTLVAAVNTLEMQRSRTYRLQVDDKSFVFADK